MLNKSSIFNNSNFQRTHKLTKSLLSSQNEQIKSISDCTTLVSSLDFMEENDPMPILQDLQTSFKKQLNSSSCLNATNNPNAKKSRILVVQSPCLPKINKLGNGTMETQILQLQKIEKKTQDLVLKSKEQKKQLKQLKKQYIEKVQQLVKCKQLHLDQTTFLNTTIKDITNQKANLLSEKEDIQRKMNQLQFQIKITKSSIVNYKLEKEQLLNTIQLYQINFQDNPNLQIEQEYSIENRKSEDLNRQISIINRLLIDKEKPLNSEEMIRILSTKISFLEERQVLKVKEARLKSDKKMQRLNQLILSRNNLIKLKNQSIVELSKPNNSKKYICQDKLDQNQETKDTFFQKQISVNQPLINYLVQERDNFKHKVRRSIQQNTLRGHQQTYETIERIVLGMIHLFENKKHFSQEDVAKLLNVSLCHLNSQFTIKAKAQVNKIQKMLKGLSKNQKNIQFSCCQKQNNLYQSQKF